MTTALIQIRRDTAANWTAANPTLAAGEQGWESDTDLLKIGDGATAWNSLAYHGAGSGTTVQIAKARRTSGDITFNNASWANVDTGLDLVFTGVSAGDDVDYSLNGYASTQAVHLYFDVATIVSGSPVNYLATAGGGSDGGNMGWHAPSGIASPIGGLLAYTVQSGDLSAGVLTLRLRARGSSATNRTISASTTTPLICSARHFS
jgi:hypothetical protein